MSKFVPLKVVRVIRETSDASTIVFEKPTDGSFNYKAGQYLTLKLNVAGESLRRAYSLCTSPYVDSEMAVTVKRVEGGRVSNFVYSNLKAGDSVEVFPPMGNFSLVPNPSSARHVVLFGGGSGITPLMSILKTVLGTEPESRVTLVYGNKDEESIIFKAELEQLVEKSGDRFRVVHILSHPSPSWIGMKGLPLRHVVLGMAQDIMNSDKLPKSYWMCGPGPMMEEVQAALGFLGIPREQIHRENFAASLPEVTGEVKAAAEAKRGDYTITVRLDGAEKKVLVKSNQTVLEAVIGEGMDPPYACQMGVCCTCRAMRLSGKVEMEEDEGLSDAEIAEGYILTCQSHPLTPDVVIEYR
ncbi:MAG: ferredoxin--NADP reductase [Bacteroidia bacterium]